MSTYTDLHNRIKENITVDYNNRITPQRVRLFNEQNEFWGTLRGHVSAENINIDGGFLSGVTIKDSILTGNVILPGGYDLGKIGDSIKQISVDLEQTEQRLYKEEDIRATEDLKLNIRIDNLNDDVKREFGIISAELTEQDRNISVCLEGKIDALDVRLQEKIDAEVSARKDNDKYLSSALSSAIINVSCILSNNINFLSDSIDTTNFNLDREIYDRVLADGRLLSTIICVDLSSNQRDDALLLELSNHNVQNAKDFAYADVKMLSTVEHERHYIINKDKTTDSYPYEAKDYAVNVFRANIPDGRVSYTNANGITTEVGRIQLDSDTSDKLPFTFTTYSNISDPAIASALVGNTPYSFTEEQKKVATGLNSYSIKYTIPSISGAQLSDAKLNLVPILPEYHKIYLSGTPQMIGKFYDTLPDGACSAISSGMLFIDTNDLSLMTFNKFKNIHFDLSDDQSLKLETERVTYLGNNEFKLEKNIDSAKYIQLTNVSNDIHEAFARIYDCKNGISGILSDATGITGLNVFVNLPIEGIAYLDRENGFSDVIKSTQLQDVVVSAQIFSNTSADIDVVYKKELYKYAFTRPNDVGEIVEIGHVIPNVYNKTLQDTPQYDIVSVDASQITDIPEFAKTWALPKVEDNLWMVEIPNDNGDVLNIKYNEINVFVKIVNGTTHEITRRKYDVKIEEPRIANPEECHNKRFCSGLVDLEQKRIDLELPEVTYYAKVDPASSIDEFEQYVLDIDTSNNDSVKITFPEKTTSDISREFFITIKLDCKTEKVVKADFRYKDGTPVTIFNNKHKDLYIIAGSNPKDWVTYMVNEVQPNKFLVTDLNDYEDHQILEQLRKDISYLSAQHDLLSTTLSSEIIDLSTSLSNVITEISSDLYVKEDIFGNKGLSGKVDFLLSVDKETMNYKGILPWLSNYTDPSGEIRPYALLSTFIKQSPNILIDDILKQGDMFKVSAVQSCLIDCNEASVYIGENDYFVANKVCRISEILTSDIDIFRNSESELDLLSNWVANTFFNRLTNNEVSGNNTFVGDNNFSKVNINQLSADNTIADSISTEYLNAHSIIVHNEQIENSTISMLDVSALANIDAANIQELNARDSYLNGFTQISDQIVNNLSIESLNKLSILDKSIIHEDPSHGPIVTYISTLQDVLNLSVDNLSAEIKEVSSFIYDKHYAKSLSTDISVAYPADPQHVNAVVDQLLIKDEITFDLYRLTIRNGALNINLVEKFENT